MINKKHLLDSIKEEYPFTSEDFYEMVKGLPEEPEIDFDAIWEEYEEKYSCKKTTSCDNCTYPNKRYYTTICFVDFLKSKNLTAPKPVDMDALRNEIYASIQKPVEIPVKKTWTLKKEYQEAFKDFDFSFNRVLSYESEPAARRIKYYDKHEQPDYSKIPKGSIVVVCSKDDKIKSAEIVEFFDNSHIYCNGGISYELKHVKIRIVELAKE